MKFCGFLLLALLGNLSGQEIGVGSILLANPELSDPNFSHTVVLLVHLGDEGAMGLVLNRLVQNQPKPSEHVAIHVGGPVEREFVFALFRSSTKVSGALRLANDVYLLADKDLIRKRVQAGKDLASFCIYRGYAGWGPDQLDREVAAGAWTILPFQSDTIFDPEPATLWDRLNERSHLRIAEVIRSTARESDPPG